MNPLNEHCSCGGLDRELVFPSRIRELTILTQVEVVVLRIAESGEDNDGMDEGYTGR